ncbi:hypothetical protein A9G13_02380 [Gilliamella sp. wkB178]|uniref:hypothetical protein n=1 Tax=Gilliamella sp. wkB178 TaxID=3120259 RepID=UPI00080E63A1|nr:hypothetical protein [Gilliamella apicola]OCG08927.1 hypothetical protein A9G13_02380 [Gilliamella apicola]
MPWLLLPYATTTQALSATTAQVIHGSAPYLTFDNGVTKVTTTEALLSITISDGTTQTTYTPDNTSTAANPIVLRVANQRFTDIGMLVPTNTDSITLNALIGAPYNYWGDDDGDGQGANGVTASGDLTVSITDKDNQAVSRNAVLSICGAPYKVALTSTAGSLTTQYGLPNSSNFTGSTAIYYISPKAEPAICYARPIGARFPATYTADNFPSTGANNLYFDLLVEGINASTLTWPTVTNGNITATMTPTPSEPNNIRVTLTGPDRYDRVTTTLPQSFVIVGKDSSNREVLKYIFGLQHWFVNSGNQKDYYNRYLCDASRGYRMPQVKDLTNATCGRYGWTCSVDKIEGAKPSSGQNRFSRVIRAGFFSEWGDMSNYTAAGFTGYLYWTSDYNNTYGQHLVYPNSGRVVTNSSDKEAWLCAYP